MHSDGIIRLYSHGGASSHSIKFYKLPYDGSMLEELEFVIMNADSDLTPHYYLYSEETEITAYEYEAIEKRYTEKAPYLIEWKEITVESAHPTEDLHVNLLDTMSDADWMELNYFFSKFSESLYDNYSSDSYDDKNLITFAVWHIFNNDFSKIKKVANQATDLSGWTYSVDENDVSEAIKQYFGVEITHQSAGNSISYKGDVYHCALGESLGFISTQVVEFYQNDDGTYTALVEEYTLSHTALTDDMSTIISKDIANPFYQPKEN